MIKLNRSELPTKLSNWKNKSENKTQVLINSYNNGEAITITKYYKTDLIKDFLLDLSNEKCAYCECDISAGASLDVEHYRPKGGVTDENNNIIIDRNEDIHPGYFWLAYDWKNLLMACSNCNRGSGKQNKFPIKNEERRAFSYRDSISNEEPLLLNPFDDNPDEHLSFYLHDKLGGIVKPISPEGEMTIRVCDLNREGLSNSRGNEWKKLKKALLLTLLTTKKRLVDDKMEFSGFLRYIGSEYLDAKFKEAKSRFNR